MTDQQTKIPKGYKQTDLGVIPEDWEVKKLGDIGKILTGGTPSTKINSYWGGKYIWVTPTDIKEHKNIYNTDRCLTQKGVNKVGFIPKNSLLVTCIASIGKNAIIKKDGACNQQINAIIPKENDVDFLYYLISYNTDRLLEQAGQTATPIINKNDFSTITFVFPPLPEQQAIARVLSDVDELIEALDKLITKKQKIKQGTMQKLLTGKYRLPGFGKGKGYKQTDLGLIPEDWEVKMLGEVIKLQGGYSFKSKYFSKIGIPIIRISNIQNQQIKFEDLVYYPKNFKVPIQFFIKNGDILIAMSGATTGKIGLYKKNKYSYQNQRVGKFVIEKKKQLNNNYLYHFISSDIFKRKLKKQLEQAAQPNISSYQISNIPIPLPPLPEQQAIAQVLSDMDEEIEALKKKKQKYERIKKGIMQVLLTGKIRLKDFNKV